MPKDPRNFAYGRYWHRDEHDELVPDDDQPSTPEPVQAQAERVDWPQPE